MYFKRNINYTITDFLLTLSYETWESVFEDNYVNTIFNSFLNTFLRHVYSSFPMVRANKPSNHIGHTNFLSTREHSVLVLETTITLPQENFLRNIVKSSQRL